MESSNNSSPAITVEVDASSGEWKELLQQFLGEREGAAVAASLARREVVINVSSPDDQGSAITAPHCCCCMHAAAGMLTPQATAGCLLFSGNGEAKTDPDTSEHDKGVVTEEPDSVLHAVAAAGDSERHLKCATEIHRRASRLLTMGAPRSRGDTPLHCAARAGNTKMVAHLTSLAVKSGQGRALVSAQNKRGETALHEAVRFDHLEMVEALIKADKQVAQVNANDGTSPLYLACSLRLDKIVEELLKEDNHQPSYSGPRGQNALHAAVLHKGISGIAYFPLIWFLTSLWQPRGRTVITSLLNWKKEELVRQKDMDGNTPLHFAASAPDPSSHFTHFVFSASDLVRYPFRPFIMYPRPFTRMCERAKHPLSQLLEADPTSAFEPDKHGSFPVHVAASADSMTPLVILLTKYPGCARLRDADGRTFLHIAVQKKRLHAVWFVCQWYGRPFSKSVVNVQDKNGDTALHIAVREGELDMARWLIGNRHAQINLQNNQGKTPMDLAAAGVESGFYFGLTARRRIFSMLTFADALSGRSRRDRVEGYDNRTLDEKTESEKIKDFAQIVGIGSVLVATATFAAALTMPGGVWSPGDATGKKAAAPPHLAGTPVLTGSYAFNGFVISNTLAFMCSTLATFSLVYCGVAAVDIKMRFQLVSFSLALLLCSARSFCAAFAFSLYLLLANVAHGTAIASCVMTAFALLDGLWFLVASYNDTLAFLNRKVTKTLAKVVTGFLVNMMYLFWPYLVIGGFLGYDFLERTGRLHGLSRH